MKLYVPGSLGLPFRANGKLKICGVVSKLFIDHVFVAYPTEARNLRLFTLDFLLKRHEFREVMAYNLCVLRLLCATLNVVDNLPEMLLVRFR